MVKRMHMHIKSLDLLFPGIFIPTKSYCYTVGKNSGQSLVIEPRASESIPSDYQLFYFPLSALFIDLVFIFNVRWD